MTNYNGPDGFTAHCSNCGHLKIRHSFIGSRCPGTFEQGPVVQQEMALAVDEPVMSQDELDAIRAASVEEHYGANFLRQLDTQAAMNCGHQDDVARTIAKRTRRNPEFTQMMKEAVDRQKQIDSAEWVSRVSDALAAAKELVEMLEGNEDMTYWTSNDIVACSYCLEYDGKHLDDCSWSQLRERILAAT